MGVPKETKGGVYINVNEDKKGTDHVNIYSDDPRGDHTSIHININTKAGKGSITDTTNGGKETTDTQCYLITSCMRHFNEDFDDAGYELTVLRWFRDKFVSKEDIEHYYEIAPTIVEAINECLESDEIYNYIYKHVIDECVKAIEAGNYDFAYSRYKNSILAFEETYAKPMLGQRLIKVLKAR